MGIVDKILHRLTSKAVEKYSDNWDEFTTWIIIGVIAMALAFLHRKKAPSTGPADVAPWNDDDTRDAVLDGMEDDELQAEIDRRREIKALGNLPAVGRPS